MNYKDIITLCEKCGSLTLISENKDTIDLISSELQSKKDVLVNLNIAASSSTSDLSISKDGFPICSNCCKSVLNEKKIKNTYLEEIKRNINALDIDKFKDLVQNKISCNNDMIESYNEAITINHNRELSLREDDTVKNQQKNTIINTRSEFRGVHIFQSVFRIYFDRHYGTINGFRIGQNKSYSIPILEINTALMFLLQLLDYICRKIDIPSNIIFHPGPYINDTIVEATNTRKKGTISTFNKGIEKIFSLYQTIYMTLKDRMSFIDTAVCPYIVDNKNKRIHEESFLYDINNPVVWTLAMKKLLMNLKFIQVYMFMS